MGEPTGLQCAAQALPLRAPSAMAESTGSSQNVCIWVGVNARVHPLLTARGSHTHTEKVPVAFHSLLSHHKVVGGCDQRQHMHRTLWAFPRTEFGFIELGTRLAVLGSHLCAVAHLVRAHLLSEGRRHDSSLATVVLSGPTMGLPFARGATSQCGKDHIARDSAVPSGQTELGGFANSQTATIFLIGFFRAAPSDKQKESLPTGCSSKPPFPLGGHGGRAFPRGTCGEGC